MLILAQIGVVLTPEYPSSKVVENLPFYFSSLLHKFYDKNLNTLISILKMATSVFLKGCFKVLKSRKDNESHKLAFKQFGQVQSSLSKQVANLNRQNVGRHCRNSIYKYIYICYA